MPFWVYGRDEETGEETDPFFSVARTAEEAVAQAEAQGLLVDRVEEEADAPPEELKEPVELPVTFAASRRHQTSAGFFAAVLMGPALGYCYHSGLSTMTGGLVLLAAAASIWAFWHAARLRCEVTVTELGIEVDARNRLVEYEWRQIAEIESRTQSRYQQMITRVTRLAGVLVWTTLVDDSLTICTATDERATVVSSGIVGYDLLCQLVRQECFKREIDVTDIIVTDGNEREVDQWT